MGATTRFRFQNWFNITPTNKSSVGLPRCGMGQGAHADHLKWLEKSKGPNQNLIPLTSFSSWKLIVSILSMLDSRSCSVYSIWSVAMLDTYKAHLWYIVTAYSESRVILLAYEEENYRINRTVHYNVSSKHRFLRPTRLKVAKINKLWAAVVAQQ